MWSRRAGRRESSSAAISRLEIPSAARYISDADKIRFAIRYRWSLAQQPSARPTTGRENGHINDDEYAQ